MFPEALAATAAEVLAALIDARLLTSREEPGPKGESRTRIEMIHESLLTGWPRLVRWRTQDAEGALLRDDLRTTARRWQERGRPDGCCGRAARGASTSSGGSVMLEV